LLVVFLRDTNGDAPQRSSVARREQASNNLPKAPYLVEAMLLTSLFTQSWQVNLTNGIAVSAPLLKATCFKYDINRYGPKFYNTRVSPSAIFSRSLSNVEL
jgi:hypothetical protein